MAPAPGPIDQATAVLLLPVTLAANCWVCPADKVALGGETVTEMLGDSVTVAVADMVGSAWLVAVTVTVCWPAMLAGAM